MVAVVPETKGRDLDEIALLFVKEPPKFNASGEKSKESVSTEKENVGVAVDRKQQQSMAKANGIDANDSEITKL